MSKKIIENNLKHLGLSDREVQVYVALTELWESSILHIAKKSELTRTTVKSILDRLADRWYISIHKYSGINHYWIESPETLKAEFENKIELTNNLSHLLNDLYKNNSNMPYSQVYDTKDSIRKFIEKTISNAKKWAHIFTVDSPKCKNYNKYFTKEYFENLLLLKKKKNIFTRTMIPSGQSQYIDEDSIKKQYIEVREMPKSIEFDISIWIIEDTLVLFSSSTSFIVELKNPIISASFQSLVMYIWENSDFILNSR